MMQPRGLTVRRFPSSLQACRVLARRVAADIRANPSLVLGLPTGRTPVPLYAELAHLHAAGDVDFSRVVTFNLDEFVGLSGDDPRSYRAFMERHLFGKVNLQTRRIHFLNGLAPDAAHECRNYERQIAKAGGIDLMILGLGVNGHIGFNEPGASLVADTHRTVLTRATRRANAGLFGGRLRDVPGHAVSMGMATILRARRIVLLATGRNKATAVRRLTEERITTRVPASFLQLHPSVEVWVDDAASVKLSVGER